MKNVSLCMAVLACGVLSAAQTPLYYPDATLGVNPIPVSENTWKACRLTAGGDAVTDADRKILPGEFFELEYGQPLAAFDFADGFKRDWGQTRATPDEPGIVFPRGWGAYPMGHWAIAAEVVQDKDVSEWTLVQSNAKGEMGPIKFSFKAAPGVPTRCFIDQGMIRMPNDAVGLSLRCVSTNGVKGTVKSLKLVAYEIPLEFRKTFTLDAAPAYAGASVSLDPFGEVIVNGRSVKKAARVRAQRGLYHVDITAYLKPGANTVGYRRNAACGWGKGVDLTGAMEFFTVDDAGKTTVYGSDATWESRVADRPWTPAKASRSPIGIETMPNGVKYCDAGLPLHAGALKIAPRGEKFPVFDYDCEIAYDLWWPKGVKGAEVKAEVVDAFTGEKMKEFEARVGVRVRDRNLTTCSAGQHERNGEKPLSNSNSNSNSSIQPAGQHERNGEKPLSNSNSNSNSFIRFPGLKPGAYEVTWTLLSDGKPLDARKDEMLVIGPIADKAYALEEMEGELAKRKRLLQTIKPADAKYDACSREFIGHKGLFTEDVVSCGRVIEECGVKMRETDPSDGAYFSWHIPVGTLGNAHIVEVDYSDAREQVIRSSVVETCPCNSSNNGWPYANANANASGSVRTGGRAVLTGKVQTMRYVFFPYSRAATVIVESGLNSAAAVSEVRIYEVPSGLPAWDAPKSDRVFMNHTERALWGQWGGARNVKMHVGLFQGYGPRMWSAAYLGAKNRVSQLRFEGHNAAIEGLYMYFNGFATQSGHSYTVHDDMDLFYVIAKMFKHNGIRLFAGFEYSLSPALWSKGFFDVSERDIWSGRKESAYHVDRYGRTVTVFGGTMGFDETHPLITESLTDLLGEIYARYAKTCAVEGLFVITGGGWLPGFVVPRGMEPAEVGFEDHTIREFEADTGIALRTNGTDPKRFQRRYELLSGEHASVWNDWRSRRMRATLEKMRAAVSSGDERWRLLVAPLVSEKPDNPFAALTSTPYMRDRFQQAQAKAMGYDPDIYGKAVGAETEYVPVLKYNKNKDQSIYGAFANDGSREMVRRADALYYEPRGLNERYNNTGGVALTNWWWRQTNAPVYETKFSGDAAYCEFVDVLDQYTPKTLICTWLDCNLPTAHDAALRNFLNGYYRTPVAPVAASCPHVTGASAHVYGGKLQLVNNTPYESRTSDGLVLAPFAVKVLDAPRALDFRFAPAVEEEIFARVGKLLANDEIVRRVRPDRIATLRGTLAGRDGYRAAVTLRDWEVARVVTCAEKSVDALAQQARFVEMLAKDGVARINCGATADLTDAKGRLWLKDQKYTGFGAYGDEFTMGYFDRGDIKIVGAGDETDLCFKTEAGGSSRILYHIPVPAGTYTLKVHIANTWTDTPGPACAVTVNGTFQTIDTWGEPNPCKYGAHTGVWKGLRPDANGEITVNIEKCPIVNGLELFKENK